MGGEWPFEAQGKLVAGDPALRLLAAGRLWMTGCKKVEAGRQDAVVEILRRKRASA